MLDGDDGQNARRGRVVDWNLAVDFGLSQLDKSGYRVVKPVVVVERSDSTAGRVVGHIIAGSSVSVFQDQSRSRETDLRVPVQEK